MNVRQPSEPRRVLQKRCSRFGPVAGLAVAGLVGSLSTSLALESASAAPAGASNSNSNRATLDKATETDFHIALSKTNLKPGKYTFEAINKGATTHNIEITGPGLSGPRSSNVSPGQNTKLTVTLKKGKYDLFCAIPGHKQLGMNVNITVK